MRSSLTIIGLVLLLAGCSQGQAAPIGKAGIGQRVESAGIALTVHGGQRVASIGTHWTAKAGKTYLVLDVTLEHTGPQAAYSPFYFRVKDGDGLEYNADLAGGNQPLQPGTLASGDKVRGDVAFQVPTTARDLTVSYQPPTAPSSYQVIRIALD